jgi:hypothetical protein
MKRFVRDLKKLLRLLIKEVSGFSKQAMVIKRAAKNHYEKSA